MGKTLIGAGLGSAGVAGWRRGAQPLLGLLLKQTQLIHCGIMQRLATENGIAGVDIPLYLPQRRNFGDTKQSH